MSAEQRARSIMDLPEESSMVIVRLSYTMERGAVQQGLTGQATALRLAHSDLRGPCFIAERLCRATLTVAQECSLRESG